MKHFLVITVLFALILSGCSCHTTYSAGTRVGSVTKLSYKGFFCKSWEGEMVLGGVRSDSEGNAVANVFAFSVLDTSLVDPLTHAMEADKRVRLTYKQVRLHGACESDTNYFIEKVEEL